MATTYDELKAEVEGWLARSDLTSDIPTFIHKAEQRINRVINVIDYEAVSAPIPTVAGQSVYPLPTDYKSARAVYVLLTNGEKVEISFRAPSQFARESLRGSDFPATYTIIGTNFELGPSGIAAGQSIEIHYYGTLVHLSATVPTNWLIDHADDCLLWGALNIAAGFNKDLVNGPKWKTDFDESLAELEIYWANYRFPSPLVMRVG